MTDNRLKDIIDAVGALRDAFHNAGLSAPKSIELGDWSDFSRLRGLSCDIDSGDEFVEILGIRVGTTRLQKDEEIEKLREALKPFIAHIGKSGEKVTLTIGKLTWADTLTTAHFEHGYDLYHSYNPKFRAWRASQVAK